MRTQEAAEFIGQVQFNISEILKNLNDLISLKNEYIALNLGTNITTTDLTNLPSSNGVTAQEFQDAVTTAISIDTFLQGAGYQKLYKIKKL